MKKIVSLLLAAVMTALLLPAGAAASGDAAEITAQVSKNGQYVEINVKLSDTDLSAAGGRDLLLWAVDPGTSPSDSAPVVTGIKPRASLSVKAPVKERGCPGYVLGYETDGGGAAILAGPAYVSDPGVFAQYTYEQPAVTGKKGLDIKMPADAQLLGVSHTVVPVMLNEYIKDGSENSISYKCGTTTYYFDKTKTAVLDYTVKTYSDAGIRVYLQLMLGPRADGQPEYLYFSGADRDAANFAFNTGSAEACGALYALVSYLTEKYTSGQSGFCGNFIVGREVNSNRYGNNAGPMSLSAYTAAYATELRIVDAAARSVYSDARVFVSVANNFNKPSYDNNADPTLDYSVMDFLSSLSKTVSDGGDFPWCLSVDPYNVDRTRADFRGAEGAEYTYESRYLTMDNINIITSLLSQPAYLYNGERRRVIIGEISYPCAGNSEQAQKAQAAAYALAYYKAEANSQIDAIIYADHVDDADSAGNCGLYTREDGTNDTAAAEKIIYRVFRYIDTEYSSVITEQCLSYYGLVSWGEAVSGYDPSNMAKRTVISGTAMIDEPSSKGSLDRLTDFNGADLMFYPSENARLLTTQSDPGAKELYGSENSLLAELYAVSPVEYRGATACREFDVSGASHAVVDVMINSTSGGIADVMLRIKGSDAEGAETVYEGIAAVTVGQYYRLYFDLQEYMRSNAGKASSVSVWVKPHKGSENGEYTMLLNGVSVMREGGRAKAGTVFKTILIILISIAVIAAAAYGIMYLRALINYRKKKKRIEEKRRRKSGERI